MEVKFNSNINQISKTSFTSQEKNITESDKSRNPSLHTNSKEFKNEAYVSKESKSKPKGILSKIAYAWVNLSEGIKGLAVGFTYGVLAGSVFAVGNSIYSMRNRIKAKEAKFSEAILHPIKSMSKTGKILSFVVGGVVLAGNLVIAKLKANKRTADVDHMLYDGHRSK